MRTIILPGYSPHNREWAGQIAADLKEAEVHPWKHWETGGRMDPSEELKAILRQINVGPVNLLAKSVGCRMAAHATLQHPAAVNQVLLCGIPSIEADTLNDLEKLLNALGTERILVVQNAGDPYVPFQQLSRGFQDRQLAFQVLERPRADHHYPYPEDFKSFLEDAG